MLHQAFFTYKQQDNSLELIIIGDFNKWDLLQERNSLVSHSR